MLGTDGASINNLMCFFFMAIIPQAIAKLTPSYIRKHLPSMHKAHTGLTDAQAEIEYLKVGEARRLKYQT